MPRLDVDAPGLDNAPLEDLAPTHWKAVASGGSTGRPKVIVDNGPGRCDLDAMPVAAISITPEAVLLSAGPLYHNEPFAFTSLALFTGARVVGMARFEAEEALRLIEAERVTWACLVPTMMQRIWALPTAVRERYDVSSLRFVWHMAAKPCRWATWDTWTPTAICSWLTAVPT